ncbi:MAG TPA: elongation factor P maturation arginine rhamnosyltransferase EarP [Burkholderiales bacterium]|nr:elongation factor P maturation arginine rhamnosyltransferase EarP [Burkholderiales bacterium]
MVQPLSWDIFCRVVDNFGDAGVCWRLAKQLADEYRARVRLFIDGLQSLHALNPDVALVPQQSLDNVEVRDWQRPFGADFAADIVVEAFGCGLPDAYVAAMDQAARASVWIVLEYLSAEAWVREHHGLPSPHPRFARRRYFFFPGFTEGTGGVLRERDLFSRRDAFNEARRAQYWRALGYDMPPDAATVVSLFAYDTAPIAALLDTWSNNEAPVVALVPQSRAADAAVAHLRGGAGMPRVLRRGALELRVVPFVPQREYDELLWACDCNFVRGEDSFVRAQWAARPFVWHIYPQADQAHRAKLEAFLERYSAGLEPETARAAADMMRAWNQTAGRAVTVRSAWAEYAPRLAAFRQHGAAWADRLAGIGDLAGNLAQFCSEKLK